LFRNFLQLYFHDLFFYFLFPIQFLLRFRNATMAKTISTICCTSRVSLKNREVKQALEIPHFAWGKEKWPNLGVKYLVIFSSRSLKKREKCISFAQLVLLSLYFFIVQKLKSKHTSLKKYTNWIKLIYFSLFLREQEEKKIFRTLIITANV
jgi:hypothetical protein